jgi:hypothetical protein
LARRLIGTTLSENAAMPALAGKLGFSAAFGVVSSKANLALDLVA